MPPIYTEYHASQHNDVATIDVYIDPHVRFRHACKPDLTELQNHEQAIKTFVNLQFPSSNNKCFVYSFTGNFGIFIEIQSNIISFSPKDL